MSQPYGSGGGGFEVPAPEPRNAEAAPSIDDIRQMIDDRVAQVQSEADKRIAELEKRHREELKAARGLPAVDSIVPTHAGGPGDENAQTWSLYHQELSRRGELTDAHLRDVNGEAPAEEE